jgi:hypothetical protein
MHFLDNKLQCHNTPCDITAGPSAPNPPSLSLCHYDRMTTIPLQYKTKTKAMQLTNIDTKFSRNAFGSRTQDSNKKLTLGKCLSSHSLRALRHTGAGVAWWQGGQWIGLSAYDHKEQQGDWNILWIFCSNICTVHRVLLYIVTTKRTINNITVHITSVCLCNLHCYTLLSSSDSLQPMSC